MERNRITNATAVSRESATLGEGPIWDERAGLVYWLDILAGRIYSYDPATKAEGHIDVGQMVGVIGLREGEGFVAGLHHGFFFVDAVTGETTPIVDPQEPGADTRFNDGAVDPAGRFWAGTLSLKDEAEACRLYRLDTDGSVETVLDKVTISNGIVWSSDHRRMYYIDTPTGRVDAFDYDADTGSIANRRTAVEIPEGSGYPDGMAIDADDKIWVAHWDGWRVTRWDPENGRLLDTIELSVARPTSCVFGGPDLRTLFISTARMGLSEKELEAQPDAGRLFALEPGAAGLPPFRYRGG
ncbi:MAG: SMP-30/gluconolactonase/LRE family protein [Spirochaetaceae bacterium]